MMYHDESMMSQVKAPGFDVGPGHKFGACFAASSLASGSFKECRAHGRRAHWASCLGKKIQDVRDVTRCYKKFPEVFSYFEMF